MNLYFRLLLIVLLGKWKKPLQPLETSVLTLHVLPTDLDLNRHMNNGRFLTIMDLGRMDFLKRTGVLGLSIKNKWMPVVGTATIAFKRPLKCWQEYQLHTHVLGWDEKWIYLEQTFYSKEKVIAVGRVKGLLRGKNGNIAPQFIIDKVKPGISSPVIKKEIQDNLSG